MEKQHRDILFKERVLLLENLGDVQMIVERLYAGEVFTEDEKDVVLSKTTPTAQRSALLDLLPRKGPNAFETFLNALGSEGSDFMVDALRDSLTRHQEQNKGEIEQNLLTQPSSRPDFQNLTAERGLEAQNVPSTSSYQQSGLQPQLKALNQPKPVPAKPSLISIQFELWGRTAFDPEGNLLCLRTNGTATVVSGCNGSVITKYATNISGDIHCAAVSTNRIAVIHVKYNTHIVELFNRTSDQISFTNGLTIGNVRDPRRCAFTSNQCLIVTEQSSKSIAMLDDGANLLRRIELDFKPYSIAVDEDDSFYVSDYNYPRIDRFKSDGTAAGILQCRDEGVQSFQPFGIAIDRNNRRLLVCDHHGNRVLQLSGNRFVEWLNEEDEIDGPVDIAYNQMGQLALYSWKTGQAFLYDMN